MTREAMRQGVSVSSSCWSWKDQWRAPLEPCTLSMSSAAVMRSEVSPAARQMRA